MSKKKATKKALLATVAIMTLNLSTVGGTIPVFAAEEQTTKTFQIDSEGVFKISGVTVADQDTVIGMAKLMGNLYYSAVKNGNADPAALQKMSREFLLGGIALIPYGGSFASSIIGSLWPDGLASQMEKMMKELADQMDQKIEIYDNSTLRQELKTLQTTLKTFEDSVNNITSSRTPNGVQYVSGNIEESNRIAAKGVQDSFVRLINLCQKDGQKEAELPLFTIVATAHLEFLKFMEKNYDNSRIQMDKDTLNSYYTGDLKETAKKYRDYILKTSAAGQQKIYKKMVAFPDGTYSTDPIEVYNALFNSQIGAIAAGGDGKRYKDAMEPYKKTAEQLQNYVNATEESQAFKIIVESIIGSPEPVAPSDFDNHDIVLSVNGKNVLATDKGEIRADSTVVGGWEKLTLVRASNTDRDNIYALRATGSNNKFVAFNTISGKVIVDANSENDPRAKFKLISLGNGKYVIKPLNTNGNLVYANFHSNGPLSVNSREITDWSTFTISSYTGGPVKDRNGNPLFQ